MTEVTLDQDKDQKQLQIETGLDGSDVENIIILPRTVQRRK